MTIAERIELAFRAGYGYYDSASDASEAWEEYKRTHDMSESDHAVCPDCRRSTADCAADHCTSKKWHRS